MTGMDSTVDKDEYKNRLYNRYPRLARVLESIIKTPLSGNTLRVLIGGEQKIDYEEMRVRTLQQPVLMGRDSPLVISQFANYGSSKLVRFWSNILPDIQERYGNNVRFEHYDVPGPSRSATSYKLATTGRAIQDQADESAFWNWFNNIMISGVHSVHESHELIDDLDIEVDKEYLEDAVNGDLYREVIEGDTETFFAKLPEEQLGQFQGQYQNNEPIYQLFVNGVPVSSSYDSLVMQIEQTANQINL